MERYAPLDTDRETDFGFEDMDHLLIMSYPDQRLEAHGELNFMPGIPAHTLNQYVKMRNFRSMSSVLNDFKELAMLNYENLDIPEIQDLVFVRTRIDSKELHLDKDDPIRMICFRDESYNGFKALVGMDCMPTFLFKDKQDGDVIELNMPIYMMNRTQGTTSEATLHIKLILRNLENIDKAVRKGERVFAETMERLRK